MIVETERLYLRPMEQQDFADLAEILQDREVVYAYEHNFTDADVTQWLNHQIARYEEFGFGLWAVVEKNSNRMIGQAGLTMQTSENQKVLEIGYLFKKAYWHQGYASEAAAGCREYAFRVLGVERVYAIIKTDNLSSIRVAERIGMMREKEFTARYYNGNIAHYLYSVGKEEGARDLMKRK